MGSYRKAIMTGFICRLCSEHKSVVIHIYSKRAKTMALLDKITLLPITIKKNDRLPKTICEKCIENLCRQFDLVQQIRKSVEVNMRHRMLHSNGRCPIQCPLHGTESEHNRQRSLGTEATHPDDGSIERAPIIQTFADIVNHVSQDIARNGSLSMEEEEEETPANAINNISSNFTNS